MKKPIHQIDYLDKTHQNKKLIKLFQLIFDYVLEKLDKKGDFELSLSLVNAKEQQELNNKYRQINRPTDVLTFPYEQNNTDVIIDLGSIIICPEIAKKQAKEYDHPFERELAFLFIHGLLHIFGYDHIKEDEAKVMYELQNSLLNNLPYDFYTDMTKLKKELNKAQNMSIAKYSHFRVGAVVVTKDFKYHLGFNIENASYPATVCAERVALFSTYAQGYKKEDIVALGCITDSKHIGTCCGVCRQVMSELMPMHAPVYIYSANFKEMLRTTVSGLLPFAFTSEDLNK